MKDERANPQEYLGLHPVHRRADSSLSVIPGGEGVGVVFDTLEEKGF
jgi:hypothetical protein